MAQLWIVVEDEGVENRRAKIVKPKVRRANSRGWQAEIQDELDEVMELAQANPEITWEDVLEGDGVA